jgi:hypothetical protein
VAGKWFSAADAEAALNLTNEKEEGRRTVGQSKFAMIEFQKAGVC